MTRPTYDHTDAAASPFSEWGRRKEAPCRTTGGFSPQNEIEMQKVRINRMLMEMQGQLPQKYSPIEGK